MNGVCYRLLGKDSREFVESKQLNSEALAKIGLAETFADALPIRCWSQQGTAKGVVIYPHPESWNPKSDRLVVGTEFKWFKWGDYEIGYDPKGSIDPFYLKRPNMEGDYRLTDSGGKQWDIPVVHSPSSSRSRLPVEAKFDEESRSVSYGIAGSHEKLWEDAGKWMEFTDAFTNRDDDEDTANTTIPEIKDFEAFTLDLAVRILQVNYRVDLGLLALMASMGIQVLHPKCAGLICKMGADILLIESLQKKRDSQGDLLKLSPGVEVEVSLDDRQHGVSSGLQPTLTGAP